MKDSSNTAYHPLAGIRVVELSRLIIGALATVKLADFGAEVVKVEPPDVGEYLRVIPPFVDGRGVWHALLNRNKKSVALDIIGSQDDRETLLGLINAADVVVDVSRPGGSPATRNRYRSLPTAEAELDCLLREPIRPDG
jgi:alpha-methylacyl-CoA racemase